MSAKPLPELFRTLLVGFLEHINALAKNADSHDQQQRLYALKNLILSHAIVAFSEDSIEFKYQVHQRRAHVIVTIGALISRTFHIPFNCLSEAAKVQVNHHLGAPEHFLQKHEGECT